MSSLCQIRSPNRVDATANSVQATLPNPVLDRLGMQSEAEQLTPGEDPVLTSRKRPDRFRGFVDTLGVHRHQRRPQDLFAPLQPV